VPYRLEPATAGARTAIMAIGQLLGHELKGHKNMAVRQCFNYMPWRTYQQNNGVSRQATIKATVAMTGTGTPAMAA